MALDRSFPLLLMASALCAPLGAQAQTRTEVIDGATCIPYPPFESDKADPYEHWLYGFGSTAFCHLTMTGDWPVDTLRYVLFTGWSSGVMTARLCVHSYDLAVACSGAVTMTGGVYQVSYVTPPPLPPSAAGAFVRFDFPSGTVSGITNLIPVWTK